MVEHVVDVRTELSVHALSKTEGFMHTQIDAPSPRTVQQIALCNLGVIEHVSSERGKSEGIRIPNLVTTPLIEVADDGGPKGGLSIEIAGSIEGSNTDIARYGWTAVVAKPERCETCTRLGEHVEAGLPAPHERVDPT